MSSTNGDWQSTAFRQKVILNIDDALKKSANMIGPNEKSAAEIEDQIFGRSASRDNYMSMVARIILHLQSGGQNQTQTASNMNQGPMTPMMMNSNMQQAGQMMVADQNAMRTDNHLKMLTQQSPMSGISTPSPKLPLYHSPSPAPVQQVKPGVKTSGVRSVQVSSNAAYQSPLIPSPSPAAPSPAPASSPAMISAQSPSSLLASRISGIPSVESPGSFNPPSNLNLGSQESPGKTDLSDKEEQLYVEKLKQLSVYTEPLRKMIAKMQNEEDGANKDNRNLTKLKRLLSILGNPKERVPYQALLKVEDVLRRKLPFEGEIKKGKKDDKSEPLPIGHSFLEALQGQAKTNSLQSNNRLFQMLAPTLGTIHGPAICPPQVPRLRKERHEPESPLPHVVKSEIARLAGKFAVDYANDGNDDREQTVLVCSISDKTLPAVPNLVVRLPLNYPDSSPLYDTNDYETSDFLQRIKTRLKNKLVRLLRVYTFTTLLLNWESAVRYADARCEKVKNEI
ncbi:mediator of RNA polymerase II transcription subunit 15-like [Dendronephthya gigantea]|uniref:mediator of RNA polymerase II transcription subunit 15-like n=1 Tax=Dendronephthya gigantea TaxID=151771 RepID=UPI00106BE3A1|nr:mediator of RNA polymerase II transcription subunit 15-like [Dendronephthya gigantea]